ncbi:TPA: diguanylate cyclase [Clostridioides difficile]|nr:diguanylate cyclase [Clostridioides difficile]
MDKKIDVYQKIAILTAILGEIIILLAFAISPSNSQNFQVQKSFSVNPDKIHKIDEQTKEYIFDFDFMEEDNNCLYFISDLNKIWIYQDEKLIYSIEDGTTFVGKTPGKSFHFIEIPPGQSTYTIIFQANDKNKLIKSPEFEIGDCKSIFREKLVEALPYTVIYSIVLLCGFALFLYWLIVRKELNDDKTGLHFSLLLIVTGLWLIRGSDFINILYFNDVVLYFMGYILFLQIPFLLFLFSTHYFQVSCKVWIKNLVSIVSLLNIFVCTILHITGIKEFRETVFLTHILLILDFITILYCMYIYWKKHKLDYKIGLTLFPLIFIIVSTVTDYLGFYGSNISSYKIGGIALMFFMFAVSIGVFKDLSIQLKEGRKNKIYEKLAVTDLLTGLGNRNAYEMWVDEQRESFSNIGIVLCDLNNLKYYNDNYGHELGDKYIISVAEILTKVFRKTGTCYRIGGDEFIIVFENFISENIEEYFNKIELMQEEYNKNSHSFVMKIAYGYAIAEENDNSIIDVIKRADSLMYKHKISLKAQKPNE